MKLCEECDRPLRGRQRVICKKPKCFRLRMNRRAREYWQEKKKKQQRREAAEKIKRISSTFDFQHASPEKAIKIFDEIVENDQ